MAKQTISGEFVVTGSGASYLDCIELIENGYILIPDTITELTIEQLINKKEYPCMADFDILVTGQDGQDADYGSGEDGEDGKDGGRVTITVKDLVRNVHIKASGGIGGSGGKGTEGSDGGRGGNGGNGGDGAIVDFHYDRSDPESTSYAYVHSYAGGIGGKGGSGGICKGTFGRGGESGEKGTTGAKYGDGGDGGQNGKDGIVTIHHPDGGKTVNNKEMEPDLSSSGKAGGTRMFDFGNDRDYRVFIQNHGGEYHLKKYPRFFEAVRKTRKQALTAGGNSDVKVTGDISQIQPVGIDSHLDTAPNISTGSDEEKIYNFYQLSANYQVSYANSSNVVSQKDGEVVVPVIYKAEILMKNVTDNKIVMNEVRYGDGDIMHFLEELSTSTIETEKLVGKEFELDIKITFQNSDNTLTYVELAERRCKFDEVSAESYIDTITITDPHWKKEGKTSGNVIFLYGRTPSSSSSYVDADYWDSKDMKEHYYYDNQFNNGKLGTIIPVSGTIKLKNPKNFEVTGASIDSYVTGDGEFSRSCLDYNIQGQRKTIATYREDINIKELGQKLNDNGDAIYKPEENTVYFDLRLPPLTAGKSDYDWECDIAGGFLDDSSHKCYLNGCFVLNVAHKPRVGSTNERYSISIYSNDSLPAGQDQYFVSKNGSLTVYIPPIMIYWGCYAKETLIRTGKRDVKRADEIRKGDRILAYGGKLLTVADILTGEDTEILNIETADGNHIRVSGGHAMKVCDESEPDGKRVVARGLKKGDSLMTPKGNSEIVKITVEPYNDTVYNFIFEGEDIPNYIEANGYWSGDFYAQNEEAKEEPIVFSEDTLALKEEFKRFVEDMELQTKP